jgi:3-methylfumaryl-CoA hydratase
MTNIDDAVNDEVKSWLGRSVENKDVVTLSPLVRMSAWLDRNDPEPKLGDPVPPGWHLLFFLVATPQSKLWHDGGNPRVDIQPRNPFHGVGARTMWAGCRDTFHMPLRLGDQIRRVASIPKAALKEGRNGRMAFVTIRDEIYGPQGLALTEELDLVNLEKQGVPPPTQLRPAEPVWKRSVVADTPLLFCFSALSYNTHRIHYDFPYTTQCEGYTRLLVTGPIQAVMLLDFARRNDARPIAEFSCRATHPLYEGGTFTLEGVPATDNKSAKIWTCNPEGVVCMTGDVKFLE